MTSPLFQQWDSVLSAAQVHVLDYLEAELALVEEWERSRVVTYHEDRNRAEHAASWQGNYVSLELLELLQHDTYSLTSRYAQLRLSYCLELAGLPIESRRTLVEGSSPQASGGFGPSAGGTETSSVGLSGNVSLSCALPRGMIDSFRSFASQIRAPRHRWSPMHRGSYESARVLKSSEHEESASDELTGKDSSKRRLSPSSPLEASQLARRQRVPRRSSSSPRSPPPSPPTLPHDPLFEDLTHHYSV